MSVKIINGDNSKYVIAKEQLKDSLTYQIACECAEGNLDTWKIQYPGPSEDLDLLFNHLLGHPEEVKNLPITNLFRAYNLFEYFQLEKDKRQVADLIRDYLSVSAPATVSVDLMAKNKQGELETIYHADLPNQRRTILNHLIQHHQEFGYNHYLRLAFFSDLNTQIKIVGQEFLKKENSDLMQKLSDENFTDFEYLFNGNAPPNEEMKRNYIYSQINKNIQDNTRLIMGFNSINKHPLVLIGQILGSNSKDQILLELRRQFPLEKIEQCKLITYYEEDKYGMTIRQMIDALKEKMKEQTDEEISKYLITDPDPFTGERYYLVIDKKVDYKELNGQTGCCGGIHTCGDYAFVNGQPGIFMGNCAAGLQQFHPPDNLTE